MPNESASRRVEADIDLDLLDGTAVLSQLEQASRTLDNLWRLATWSGSQNAIQYAEAAQAVHRALMALAPIPS